MRQVIASLVVASLLVTGTAAGGVVVAGEQTAAAGPMAAWSDPATWHGDIPSDGDVVTIPRGMRVLMDVSPPPLGGLDVAGELVFDRRDLSLTTEWIVVSGTLEIGTPTRPFMDRAEITLTDAHPGEDVEGMGDRVIGQVGGRIDIHGAPTVATWTRLAANADAGADVLWLEREVDWRPGQQVVVASTDFDASQTEIATIAAVNGRGITLEQPLRYLHWGDDQWYGEHRVSERAEVGLLSHNIRIAADETAAESRFGGHVMSMAGELRIEDVELRRMGQAGRLARYPIHFHMKGDAPGDQVRSVSIVESYNRCITIHGTHHVLLERNVAVDTVGHCFFLEDGAETGNRIIGNLGMLTRTPDPDVRLLPSDELPATFWITNPANEIVGNVAAGSDSLGFWIALPEHPTGLSTTPDNDALVWPQRTPLAAFRDNTAHSNGFRGLHVDDGPRADGTVTSAYYQAYADPIPPAEGAQEPPVVQTRIEGFTGYKNRERAIWLRGGYQLVTGATLADNGIGATFASYEAYLEDSVVVGETANVGSRTYDEETMSSEGRSLPMPWEPSFAISGFEFYDGIVGARDVAFAGFHSRDERRGHALGFLRDNAFQLDPRSYAEHITWLDDSERVYTAPARSNFDGDKMRVFVDRDGSVTGLPGVRVVANQPHLRTGACSARPEWNAHVCTDHLVALVLEDISEEPRPFGPLRIRDRDGDASVRLVGIGGRVDNVPTSYVTNILPGGSYHVTTRRVPDRLRIRLDFARPGDTLTVRLPWPDREPYVYRGYAWDESARLRRAARRDAGSMDGESYVLDRKSDTLVLRLVIGPDEESAVRDVCLRRSCGA